MWPASLSSSRVAIPAAVAFTLACADPPTAPELVGDRVTASLGAADAPIFLPNAQRYRNSAPPSTGRQGNATLQLLALVGRDGRADIHVQAGRADGGWPAGVKLAQTQLKGFAPDGALLFTRNLGSRETSVLLAHAAGLEPGGRLQAQAVISGADVARVGVVTVDDVVRRLPDLSIAQVTIPVRAGINTAPTLRAVVRELNGEAGNAADCVLEVDGLEVDRVHGMWVDAGGTVTCQFFHMFRSLGEHAVRVRLEPLFARDWDPTNDAAAGTIRIDPIRSSFFFDASFTDVTFDEYSKWTWRSGAVDGSWGTEQESETKAAGRMQDAWMTAYLPRAVQFPLARVEVRQSTRDGTVQGFAIQNLEADFTWTWENITQSCVRRTFIPGIGGRGWLEVCTVQAAATEWEPAGEFTHATYYRNAGDVTYHSRGSARYWDSNAGYEDAYSWNDAGTDAFGRFATYGFEYGFFLSILDQGNLYRANPIVWLASTDQQWSNPWQCWSWADDWYRSEHCDESRRTARLVAGSVYGEPWSP